MLLYCIAKERAATPQQGVSSKTAQVLRVRPTTFRAVLFLDWDSDDITLNKLSTAEDWALSMQEKNQIK